MIMWEEMDGAEKLLLALLVIGIIGMMSLARWIWQGSNVEIKQYPRCERCDGMEDEYHTCGDQGLA